MTARRRTLAGALGAGALVAAAAGGLAAGPASAPAQTPTTTTTTAAPTTTTPPPTSTTPAPAPTAPAVSTGAVSAITATGATVAASVDPNGVRTSVTFEYGTSTSYGASSAAVDAGDSDSAQAVSATLGSLRASTTYHVRARAQSAAGTTLGADRTFRTAAAPAAARPPALSGSSVTGTTETGAILRVRVAPRGRQTAVVVQYGTTTGLGAQTPPVDAGASATASRVLSLPVGGLRAGTTYRARIVATSSGGTTRSGLLRLVTRTPNAITVAAADGRVTYGRGTTLTGRLSGTNAGGVAVALAQATSPFTAFAPLPGVTTGRDGAFSIPVLPTQRTRYAVSAQPRGAAAPVTARTRSVLVAPRVGLSAERLADGRVRLSGRVIPRGSARVSLRRVARGGTLVVVAGTDVRPAGTASAYRLTRRLRAGRYLVRVLPATGRGLVSGTSRTIMLAAPRRR